MNAVPATPPSLNYAPPRRQDRPLTDGWIIRQEIERSGRNDLQISKAAGVSWYTVNRFRVKSEGRRLSCLLVAEALGRFAKLRLHAFYRRTGCQVQEGEMEERDQHVRNDYRLNRIEISA